MNEIKHTPGPWGIEDVSVIGVDISYRIKKIEDHPQGDLTICRVNPHLDDESKANAKLIAACPEMFDALQAICDAFGDQDSILVDQCKAALAKAKGES